MMMHKANGVVDAHDALAIVIKKSSEMRFALKYRFRKAVDCVRIPP